MENIPKDGKATTGKEKITSVPTCPISKASHNLNAMSCINKAAEDKDREFWLELYKLNVEGEHYFLTEHHNRTNFFVGILTALLGATIAGILKINQIEQEYKFILLLGPVIIILVSCLAIVGVSRLYQRFLESITVRAKLEDKLKLADEKSAPVEGKWWVKEAIVASRYLSSRNKFKESRKFIKAHLRVLPKFPSIKRLKRILHIKARFKKKYPVVLEECLRIPKESFGPITYHKLVSWMFFIAILAGIFLFWFIWHRPGPVISNIIGAVC